jgi:hypothetical protein
MTKLSAEAIIAAMDALALSSYIERGRPLSCIADEHLPSAWHSAAVEWLRTRNMLDARLEADFRAEMSLRGIRCPDELIADELCAALPQEPQLSTSNNAAMKQLLEKMAKRKH